MIKYVFQRIKRVRIKLSRLCYLSWYFSSRLTSRICKYQGLYRNLIFKLVRGRNLTYITLCVVFFALAI